MGGQFKYEPKLGGEGLLCLADALEFGERKGEYRKVKTKTKRITRAKECHIPAGSGRYRGLKGEKGTGFQCKM